MKQRIDYIDRMKGLAIFLVVMGHVYGFAFAQSDAVANRLISSFHMPLFMFLSGLVACSGATKPFWNLPKLGRKLRGLLLPLLVFGMCFTMTWAKDFGSGLKCFLESPNKNGYWYLMTLAVFYVSLSLYRLNVKQKWYVDVGLAIVLWGGTSPFGNIRRKQWITSVCLIVVTSILSLSWAFSRPSIDYWIR